MNISTFQVSHYRNCAIYYRNFGQIFEYLAVIKGELYTTHCRIIPHWFTRLLYWIGIEDSPYSQQQLKAILTQMKKLGETTVNYVLDKDKK